MSALPNHSERSWDLIDALLDKTLPPEGWTELEALLLADGELQQLFLTHLQLRVDLRFYHRARRSASRSLSGIPELAELVAALPGNDAKMFRLQRAWNAIYKVASNYMALSALISGLFITTILLSLALWKVPEWRPAVMPGDSEPVFVAKITATHQATWDKSSDGNFRNRELFADEVVVLQEGFAEITFESGATVLLEGPAQLTVESKNAGTFTSGKLAAKVPAKADGFVIETPFAKVTDLGTEFGIEVDNESTQVAVFQGEVRLDVGRGESRPRSLHITAGQTAKADRAGQLTAGTAADEDAGIVRVIPHRSTGIAPRPVEELIAAFDVDAVKGEYTQAGYTSLSGNADSATQNGITLRYSGGQFTAEKMANISASPAPDISRDFVRANGADKAFLKVELTGLEPNTVYQLRWHHYFGGPPNSTGHDRLAVYEDSNHDGDATGERLLFEADHYTQVTTNFFTDFQATSNAAGELHFVAGPHSKGNSIQLLNGFEVRSIAIPPAESVNTDPIKHPGATDHSTP